LTRYGLIGGVEPARAASSDGRRHGNTNEPSGGDSGPSHSNMCGATWRPRGMYHQAGSGPAFPLCLSIFAAPVRTTKARPMLSSPVRMAGPTLADVGNEVLGRFGVPGWFCVGRLSVAAQSVSVISCPSLCADAPGGFCQVTTEALVGGQPERVRKQAMGLAEVQAGNDRETATAEPHEQA
jgi:hypothetical protein